MQTNHSESAVPGTAASSRLDVMNFLNEVWTRYPNAVSFASGQPCQKFFDLPHWLDRLPAYVDYAASQPGSAGLTLNRLAQYGRTAGMINDLIARQLRADLGMHCTPDQIVVTAGCQEAIDLCVRTLCREPGAVLLVRSPTYIGITGIAELNGIEIVPFSCDDDAVAATLAATLAAVRAQGKHPRLLYLIPDFDNPTGGVLPAAQREAVIALCADNGTVILEDNPYGMFRFEGEPVPPMYALDQRGCVIHLGTYSKTLCPTVRTGFALVPPQLFGDAARSRALVDRLVKLKSFVAVNTSQLTQAVVGGMILEGDGSLAPHIAPANAHYRASRDHMAARLHAAFGDRAGQIAWNVPQGGFFLTIDLPFTFLRDDAETCARDFGVIVMPLSFFALNEREDQRIRLAFSNVTTAQIDTGVERLRRYIDHRLAQAAA